MEAVLARNLMSDAEWAFFEPFIVAIRGPGGRRPSDHRLVLDGVFWIARTGAPWRDLPEEFGKWGSVYRQFRRWTLAGLWETILEVLNDSRAVPDTVQMIDSTIVRAHHCAAGARGGLKTRISAVRKVASRPRSTCAPTGTACR
jgi:transposase